MARQEDESTGYVLSRANLVKLAQAVPTTVAQVGGLLYFPFRVFVLEFPLTLHAVWVRCKSCSASSSPMMT